MRPVDQNYFCVCAHCGEQFLGHKREVTCPRCDEREECARTVEAECTGLLLPRSLQIIAGRIRARGEK